jgi:putative transposase
MATLELLIEPGKQVNFQGKDYTIRAVLSLSLVLLEDTKSGNLVRAEIKDLTVAGESVAGTPVNTVDRELSQIPDEEWAEAVRRYNIIKPILADPGNGELLKIISKEAGINFVTLYRWLNRYNQTGTVSSLLTIKKDGGRGKGRLTPEIEAIIKITIDDVYKK